ncbi:MAG: transposase [Saprospiraceae bacterium]|nr:transposase [Saprospiraceae bacterium]
MKLGFLGFGYRKLQQLNFQCIVVNPGDVPQTNKNALNKTDKIDSKRIALALRTRQLKGIFIPSETQEDDRIILRQRAQLVKKYNPN